MRNVELVQLLFELRDLQLREVVTRSRRNGGAHASRDEAESRRVTRGGRSQQTQHDTETADTEDRAFLAIFG